MSAGRVARSDGPASTGVTQNFVKGATGPVGVVVHGGYLYWSNPGVDAGSPGTTIGRAKLDGTA